ncbi:MAG: hypothetical protein K2G82_03845, partial [Paramuribaculum sp.]|nr:hypothetical protein [Paramuribaculum sp.]
PTSTSRTWRANQLCYTPDISAFFLLAAAKLQTLLLTNNNFHENFFTKKYSTRNIVLYSAETHHKTVNEMV